jgi:hypothetical protein
MLGGGLCDACVTRSAIRSAAARVEAAARVAEHARKFDRNRPALDAYIDEMKSARKAHNETREANRRDLAAVLSDACQTAHPAFGEILTKFVKS